MRVFVASLATETNTFSPIRIDRDAFVDAFYAPPGQHPDTPTLCSAPFVAARRRAAAEGFTLIEGTAAWAEPAGLVARTAYESLRDEILAQLRAALPVQVVLLGLHGAMVADGYEDCEGDLLTRVRAIVGPAVTVGVELDPHCHLSRLMLDSADLLVCFKEVPHSDFYEVAEELVDLCLRRARGQIAPVVTVFDCRAIANFMTSREPGRGLVDDIRARQQQAPVLSISVVHGFPAADVPDVGTKVIVITDGHAELGRVVAGEVGRRILAFGANRMPPMPGPEAAVAQALATDGAPVVLADRWDNPGGGVAGDSTFLLHVLLAHPDVPATVGALWDPAAVRCCLAAGAGARLQLSFGGKAAASSGPPGRCAGGGTRDHHRPAGAVSEQRGVTRCSGQPAPGPAVRGAGQQACADLPSGGVHAPGDRPGQLQDRGGEVGQPLPTRVRVAGCRHHLRELRRALSAGCREDTLHPHPAADRAAGHGGAVLPDRLTPVCGAAATVFHGAKHRADAR
jgi:microcystin degradation protein MlrC